MVVFYVQEGGLMWNSTVTNDIFVRFGNVELSHDKLLAMEEQEHRSTTY